MKIGRVNILDIVANPFIIAIVLFATVSVFIPKDLFKKYKLVLVSNTMESMKSANVFYEDLDCDGYSERILRKIDENKINGMNMYSSKGSIINQFNFGRKAILNSFVYALDCDDNNFKEVYSLSNSKDSVFLNWVEPMNKSDDIPRSRFVTTVKYNNYGKIDYTIGAFFCADLDKDGSNEIVFTISGGYSKFPRKVFAYSFTKDLIFASPFIGATTSIAEITDINNDGFPEVLLNTSAYANIQPNDSLLDDYHSYVMVLDHNLNFLFEPISFFGYPSNVNTSLVMNKSQWYIVAVFSLTGTNGERSRIMVFDSEGNKINDKKIENRVRKIIEIEKGEKKNFVLHNLNSGLIKFYDLELNETFSKQLPKGFSIYPYDLDGDGINEWVVNDRAYLQTIMVYRQDFTHPAKVVLPVPGRRKNIFKYGIVHKGEKSLLHIQKDEHQFIFEYCNNQYYYLKFPFYITVYLILLLLTHIIQKLQKYRTERKLAIEKQISELQLKTIKNQMDPHFTFNALNTVSSIIYQEDKEKALKYFSKFSKLIRATLEASDKITRPLSEEIQFVENYLTLEEIRFREKFSYEINLNGEVDKTIEVPKMIIQIYVENAVKHGLKHLERNGLLTIDISQYKDKLTIIIEDNGIGRKQAALSNTTGTGRGMKIMLSIGDLYYRLYKKEIGQTVEDLYDNSGSSLGTRVSLKIPI